MDVERRNLLVESIVPLAWYLAKRFAKLARPGGGLVFRQDEVRDAAQEAILAVMMACDRYDETRSFVTYAYLVIHKTLCKWVNARARAPIPIGDCIHRENGQEHSREAIHEELNALDAALAEVGYSDSVLLRAWFGVGHRRHTVSQIAVKLGVSRKAARKRLEDAMEGVRARTMARLDATG